MRLTDRTVEKVILRAARRKLKKSSDDWRAYRAHRGRGNAREVTDDYGSAGWMLAFILLALNWVGPERVRVAPISVVFFATGQMLTLGHLLWKGFHSPEMSVLAYLPLTDTELISHQQGKLLRSSTAVFGLGLALFSLLALQNGRFDLPTAGLALCAAVVLWAVTLLVAILIAHYRPTIGSGIGHLLHLVAFVVVIWIPEKWMALLEPASNLPPPGWVVIAFRLVLDPQFLHWGVLLLGALAVAGFLFPVALLVMRERYAIQFTFPAMGVVADSYEPEILETQESKDDAFAMLETRKGFHRAEMGDLVLAGALEAPPGVWQGGWMERAAFRWLTRRERVVAEVLLADRVAWWTTWWERGVMLSAGGAVIAAVLTLVPGWVSIIPVVILVVFGVAAILGKWPGFEKRFCGEKLIPLIGIFPVSYWEISRVAMKIYLLRTAAWFPVFSFLAAAIVWRFGGSQWVGIWWVAKCFFILVALQPLLIAGWHSSGTNDTQNLAATKLLVLVPAVVISLTFLAGAFSLLLFFDDLSLQWKSVLLMLAVSGLGWWGYGYVHGRGRTDLLVQPARQ